MHIGNRFIKYAVKDKRHRSVNGSILLPLALRYRLLCVGTCGLFIALCLPSVVSRTVSAASITLSISPALSVDVTPTATGTFATSEGTITVDSDAPFGYELSINSGNSSNALTSGTNTLPSITEEIDENTFKSDDKYSNTWGFKPSKKNGTANTRYLPGPSADVPFIIDATDSKSTSAVDYTITLGAKVNNEQPTGSYSQSFIVTAAAKAVNYTINYDDNGGSGGPGTVTGKSFEETITLDSKTPTRDGYEFKGWCNQTTSTGTCSGVTFHPEDLYTLSNGTNTLNLYAMWEADNACVINGERVTEIKDARGGVTNIYKVRKLKDGKCWMVENLRLGGDHAIVLTNQDTDLNSISSFTLPASIDSGFSSSTKPQINTTYANQIVEQNNPITTEKYGAYYNWSAATANAVAYSDMISGDVTDSICPKGWRLPTGGDGGDFEVLFNKYNKDKAAMMETDGPNYVFSGDYFNSGARSQGSSGSYWTSTARKDGDIIRLYSAGASDFSAHGTGNTPYIGRSIRCVLRETMQNVEQWGSSVQEIRPATAIDERDGNVYTVARLADGKLWMTQNLRIGSNETEITITPSDSDVESDFTLPVGSQKTAENPEDLAGWHFQQYNTKHIYIDEADIEFGGYYTWYAATAGEGTGGISGIDSGDTQHSICPRDWRLPTSTEITALTQHYDANSSQEAPANFLGSGLCNEMGCPRLQGSRGFWWSSTAYDGDYAYLLRAVFPTSFELDYGSTYDNPKGYGFSVRCVAREQ